MTIEEVVRKFLAHDAGVTENLRVEGARLISKDVIGHGRNGKRDFIVAEWQPDYTLVVQYMNIRVAARYQLSQQTRLHVAELHEQLARLQMPFSYVTGLNGETFEIVIGMKR
jgi:hypothetical protein